MKYSSVAVAQIDTTIGDFDANTERILSYSQKAYDRGADLVAFPELAACGYPPQDLLERPAFLEANLAALDEIASRSPDVSILMGYAAPNRDPVGKRVRNAAALLEEGEIKSKHYKQLLPTYDVFDEARYFEPADTLSLLSQEDRIAVTICEDIWNDSDIAASYGQPRYELNPLEWVKSTDAELMINVSASPFVRGKDKNRTKMLQQIADKYNLTVVMSNLVGGNDSLLFDGNSVVISSKGNLVRKGKTFEEDLLVFERGESYSSVNISFPSDAEAVYRGLTVGIKDYLDKCGFGQALVGLSGGIDSSLTASLAVDALGKSNVLGVLMPSEISSEASVTDAEKLADNLGIDTRIFPIQDLFDGYLELFEDEFAGMPWDHTEENLQARIRGNILMALSNKYGHILLTTGNKSELAVGYCTLYGDMNGGLAVISDVPKTMVYELAEYRNERDQVIPQNVLEKPPSAELSPDQKDEDDLPSYSVLDEIIRLYVEEHLPPREIIQEGFNEKVVQEIVELIDLNEYKRQQAPIGLKVTSKAFTMGWRMPIAQRFETH